jgi:hypothetical protein
MLRDGLDSFPDRICLLFVATVQQPSFDVMMLHMAMQFFFE